MTLKLCDFCSDLAKHWYGYWNDQVILIDEVHVCASCKKKVNKSDFNDYETIGS
jgi:hypothetical protein